MANAKVILGDEVLMDLTQDTVDAAHLLVGKTAHDKTGEAITGECTFDSDTKDASANSNEILATKTAYVNAVKVTGEMPNRGAVSGTISTIDGTYTIQNGYHDGSGTVSIDSTEQGKLIPQNVREGITVLGVLGTMSGQEDVHALAVTATPYTTAQTILPDSSQGYNFISQVTVEAISRREVVNPAGGKTIIIGEVAPTS